MLDELHADDEVQISRVPCCHLVSPGTCTAVQVTMNLVTMNLVKKVAIWCLTLLIACNDC